MPTPFVRIREKNKEIKGLRKDLQDIASVLSCQPVISEILSSILEALEWRNRATTAIEETESLREKIGEMVGDRVDELTFSLQLTNKKLEDKVEKLTIMLDTKDKEILNLKSISKINKKGFWDFLYKIFKIN